MTGAAQIPFTVANALSEADFERQVIDLAHRYSWKTAHWRDSRREVVNRRTGQRILVGDKGAAGFPDWILARPPELLVVELKAEKGRLSVAQSAWLRTLQDCAVPTFVWRPSDWPTIVETLKPRSSR